MGNSIPETMTAHVLELDFFFALSCLRFSLAKIAWAAVRPRLVTLRRLGQCLYGVCPEASHAETLNKHEDESVDIGRYDIFSQPSSDRVGRALLRFLDLVAPGRNSGELGGQLAPS